MKRVLLPLLVLSLSVMAADLFAQRNGGFRSLVLDDNTGPLAERTWFVSEAGSLGIDAAGSVSGTFPNTTSLVHLSNITKAEGLRISTNIGAAGMNIIGSSFGEIIDASATGIFFTTTQPNTGIDMTIGATGVGMDIDGGTPTGISIGNSTAGSDGITLSAINTGITVGAVTTPDQGEAIDANANGLAIGTNVSPNIGQTTLANIIGGTFDANVIGLDVGQSNSPSLGIGVQANNTGVDIFSNNTGINMFAFGTGVSLTSFFGNGINMSGINGFGTTGINISGYGQSITTDGAQTFGDNSGNDQTTINAGTGGFLVTNNAEANAINVDPSSGVVGIGVGPVTPSVQLLVWAVDKSLSVGGALSPGQSTGIQFLDFGDRHLGLRKIDGTTDNLILEDASAFTGAPSSWYGGLTANLVIRNGGLSINPANPEAAPAAALEVNGNIQATGDVVLSPASLQAPGGEEKLRLLQGTINDNGTINGGSGFSCSRTGVGQYSVTWTNAFPVSPGLGLAVAPIPGGALTIQITTDFTTGFTVETRNLAGTLQDANWTFVAMGIR